MNECLNYGSVFCPEIMTYESIQYFKIYFIQYFGECMKTCSILTSIAFSYERYINSASSKSKLSNLFRKMSLKLFVFLILLFGLLSSFCKVFEYSVNFKNMSDSEYPILNLPFMTDKLWFIIIYSLHYLLNDFVLLAFNLAIDIKLMRHVRSELKLKMAFMLKFDPLVSQETSKKQSEINKAERSCNKMVLYTTFIYFFFRVPELLNASILLFTNHTDPSLFQLFCIKVSVCMYFHNIIQYMYMISYSVNILIYFKFNRPFRLSFRSFLKRTKN